MTTIGAGTASWDTRGNLASDPVSGKIYGYSSEDLLTSASGGVTLTYDPLTRLVQEVDGSATTRLAYDGLDEIARYDGSNALLGRTVFDPGSSPGQPIVGIASGGARTFMSADERGSIIARTRSDGSLFAINAYDEYGKPQSSNSGRFGYTGQAWIGQIGLNYYKARMYAPHLGLFAQTDPIGMRGGANFYAYVGGDPVNLIDPLGLITTCVQVEGGPERCSEQPDDFGSGFAGGGDPFGGSSTGGFSGGPPGTSGEDIVVTAPRLPAEECSEAQSIGGCGDIVVTANPEPREPRIVPLPAAPTSLPPFVQAGAVGAYDPEKNYCGGEGGASLPNNIGGVSINDICYAHDVCYGGSGVPRETCNERFGIAISTRFGLLSKGPFYNPPLRGLGSVISGLSGYIIVRIGGKRYYVPKQ